MQSARADRDKRLQLIEEPISGPGDRGAAVADRSKPRVLILADNASERFGGEAILPLQYFRRLRSRGIEAWLITHSRVRDELSETHDNLLKYTYFVEENFVHRLLWRAGAGLNHRLRSSTTEFVSRLLTQRTQRRLARTLIRKHKINVVHQPTPVSPREPSLIYGLEAPIIFGPMNCSPGFPPSLKTHEHGLTRILFNAARSCAPLLSRVIPGKRRAAALLVANERTSAALSEVSNAPIYHLPENGVDLDLWKPGKVRDRPPHDCRFAYVGSLIRLKGVHLWLDAFSRLVTEGGSVSGLVIGDGPERAALESQAHRHGILGNKVNQAGKVFFAGWMHQSEVARMLAQQDALVFPTLCECGGAVVLEAMATQLPVIVTDWGGPRDYVDQSCGILVNAGSAAEFVQGLIDAMRRLATNPGLCLEMGRAGRSKVERLYSWDVKVESIVEHYRQAIGADWRSPRGEVRNITSRKAPV